MYDNLKGKKLLVIGSAEEDSNIVSVAKSMGIYVIVVDGKEKSQMTFAKNIADESWDIDYSKTKEIGEKCKEAGVDGVIAGYSEFRVLAACKIARYIGKPFYATEEQIELTRNKETFKKECLKYNIPVPKDYVIKNEDGAVELADVKFPVIVKPTDYAGRKGITVCYDKEALDKAIPYAIGFSESKTCVVEDYINGIEFCAVYSLSDGEISLSCFNEKYINEDQVKKSGLCDLAVTPSSFINEYNDKTDKYVKDFLRGIGAKDGVAFFQGIFDGDICYIFEMGYRLNGGNDHYLVEKNNNISYMKMLISHALTGKMGDDLKKDNPYFKTYCSTFIKYAHEGIVKKAEFLGDKNYKGIDKIQTCALPGRKYIEDGSTQQRAYSFKISADSIDELAEIIDYIQSNLVVCDKNGKDMLFKPFDVKKLRK